jgi:hypothetical protein
MMETRSADKKTRRSDLIICCHTIVILISSFKRIYYEKKQKLKEDSGRRVYFKGTRGMGKEKKNYSFLIPELVCYMCPTVLDGVFHLCKNELR